MKSLSNTGPQQSSYPSANSLAYCCRNNQGNTGVYRNVRQVSIVTGATVREVVANLFVQHGALREVCFGTCSASKCALSNVNVVNVTRCDDTRTYLRIPAYTIADAPPLRREFTL